MNSNNYYQVLSYTTYFQIFLKTIPTILLVSLFFAIGAMLNAGMDTLDHHRSDSIFVEWGKYWDDNGSLKYDENGDRKYFLDIHFVLFKHPVFFDAWHLFKALMIFNFMIALGLLYFKRSRIIFNVKRWIHWIVLAIIFIVFALVWNITFNLFYDNIFLR